MQLTVETFWMWANKLQENVTVTNGVDHNIWIVPALFRARRYLNDARYLSGDTTTNSERWENRRQNIFKFLQSKSPSPPTEFSSFRFLSIQALRNIFVREKLLVHYGIKYDFSYRELNQ